MDFSVRIAAVRKQMGLSQEEFSELVNMSRRTVAAWESGDRTPSFSTLSDVADTLNVSVDFLLGRTDEQNKKQPAMKNGGLLDAIIARVQDLPDSALPFVSAYLDGIQTGREIAQADAADPDPDAGSVR